MNWIDPNSEEAVQFETLTYVSELSGFEPGARRELAVLGDPLRLDLGKKSWLDLAEWLGARDVRCTIEGPYYTTWESRHDPSYTRHHKFTLSHEAVALVWINGIEDQVRFEHSLLGVRASLGGLHAVHRQAEGQAVVRPPRRHEAQYARSGREVRRRAARSAPQAATAGLIRIRKRARFRRGR